jgi:hypothetical protein
MLFNRAVTIPAMSISLADFELHVAAHIKRVRLLGNYIASHYFPRLDPVLTDEFLTLHDAEKLVDSQAFRKIMGIAIEEKSLLARLFKHFGRHREVRPLDEILEFEKIKHEVNSIGKRISQKWLISHGFWDPMNQSPNDLGFQLLIVEKLADVLDRELDPVAFYELGKTIVDISYNPNSADHYVSSEAERGILKEIRPLYPKLVAGETFNDWVTQASYRAVEKSRSRSSLVVLDLFAER